MINMVFCKADKYGYCSFECPNCIYSGGKEGYKKFKDLWNNPLKKTLKD